MFKNVGLVFLNSIETFKKNFKMLFMISLMVSLIEFGFSLLKVGQTLFVVFYSLSICLSILAPIMMINYIFRSEEDIRFLSLLENANRRFAWVFFIIIMISVMAVLPGTVMITIYYMITMDGGFSFIGLLLVFVLFLLTLYIIVTYSIGIIIAALNAHKRPIWYSRMLVSMDFLTVFILSFLDFLYVGIVCWLVFPSIIKQEMVSWPIIICLQVLGLFYIPFSICVKAELYKHLINLENEEVITYDKKNIQ